ncbi:MAG: MFS transporter [Deltaproteobacteria bacterium]|nr:MFS transporter [Deltaproteobacteria bacterium]
MGRNFIQRGSRAYMRANLALFFAGFVTFSTLYTFQPLFPNLVKEFGISPAVASLSLSFATFALALSLPISGSLSDAWSRRGLMGFSVLLASLLALASAASSTLPSLLVLRLLQGVALAGVPAVAMAYLNEEIDPRAIGSAMGLYIAGNACGGMTGRILTAWLTDLFSWRMAVAGIGLVSVLLALLFWLTLPASRNFRRRELHWGKLSHSLFSHLRNPGLFCLFLLAFTCMGGFVTLYNYVTFRLLGPAFALSHSQVALIFLAYAFGAGGSSVMGGLVDRFGRAPLLFWALGIMTCGLLLTLAPQLFAVIAGIIIFTIGFFGAHAIASAWVGVLAGQARAQASSLYLFAYYLGSSISGTAGGFFFSSWGWPGVVALIFLLLVCATLVGLCLTAVTRKKRPSAFEPDFCGSLPDVSPPP